MEPPEGACISGEGFCPQGLAACSGTRTRATVWPGVGHGRKVSESEAPALPLGRHSKNGGLIVLTNGWDCEHHTRCRAV